MTARALIALAALGPAAVLSAALFSQFFGGLHPCEMCIWQRWPHAAATMLAILAYALAPRPVAAGALWFGALALLIGAGIGGFHVGVELGYWEGPTTCSGGDVSALSTQELIAQIQNAPLVRCDEVAWSFLGVSMAGWNAILSVGLAALTILAAKRARRA